MKTSLIANDIVCNYGKRSVPVESITYFKSEFGNYTRIFLKEKEAFLTSFTLKRFSEMLQNSQSFFIPRKGVMVNKSHVQKIDRRRQDVFVVLKSGEKFKVSRRRKMEVLQYSF